MKKHFHFKSEKQIFRILISDTEKLLIETRDTNSKEVFFNCIDLPIGKNVFSNFQLEEKTWLGVEAVYKDVIYFHKFPKPDMPGHKEIIAFNITTQKILWHNTEYAFSFINEDKIYCYTQGFEERFFFALDYLTGEPKEDFGSDYLMVNAFRLQAEQNKDWSVYTYPELNLSSADEITKQLITKYVEGFSLAGEVEWANKNGLLFFSFHTKEQKGKMTNRFVVQDIETGETKMFETLNENVTNFLTDSFFLYKNFLFLLKGKNELVVFDLE